MFYKSQSITYCLGLEYEWHWECFEGGGGFSDFGDPYVSPNEGPGDMGSGGGGSGGSNSGGGATPPPPKNDCSKCNPPVIVAPVEPTEAEKMADHCAKLKGLSKNFATRPALNNSQENHVNLPQEQGYKLTKDANGAMSAIMLPQTFTASNQIKIPTGGNIIGAFHSHPDSDSVVPMFSADDIYTLYMIAKRYNLNGMPFEPMMTTFVFTVATKNGTYALKIDAHRFMARMHIATASKKSFRKFRKKLDKSQTASKEKTSGQYENDFLRFIEYQDLNVSIFKASSDLSQWNKLSIDSNPSKPKSTPCN